MPTQSEKINKLDKEVAIIKKDIEIIKTNHLVHLDKRLPRLRNFYHVFTEKNFKDDR